MNSVLIPASESARIERLRHYDILDTPPEDAFDRITRIVTETIGVPISLISLIDAERQWFKSNRGLNAKQTSRDIAFCAHAILGNEVFVVEDTHNDARFFDNPLVLNDPSIRFYAGAPLTTDDGHNLGTLCAIDQKHRTLSPDQKLLLEDLASVVINLMELREAQRQSEKDREAAKSAEKVKSEFLATISHEMRTPLAAVIGFSELILEEEVNAKVREYATKSLASGERLLTILNEVIDIALLKSNRMEINRNSFNPREVFLGVRDFFEESAAQKDLEVKTTISPNLPEKLVSDPRRIRQIWLNLMGNAVKFTEKGTIHLILKFEASNSINGKLLFKVQDTGIGIAENVQSNIFQEFFQVEGSAARNYGGPGLGLAICRRFSNLLGGELNVTSEIGKGSAFSVSIPCKIEERNVEQRSSISSPVLERLLRLCVLIVEDDKVMQMLTSAKIKKHFSSLLFADNGQEAVDLVREGNIDIVLMDIRMPIMNGIEATRIIREMPEPMNRIPIIGVTGDFTVDRIKECMEVGMSDVKPKTFNTVNLIESIVRTLNSD